MSDRADDEQDFDVDALAALARPSLTSIPPPPSDDEGDAKVDLKTLTSMVPPPPDGGSATEASSPVEERVAPATSASTAASAVGPTSKPVVKTVEVPAQVVAQPASGGMGKTLLGVVLGAGVAVAAIMLLGGNDESSPAVAANAPGATTGGASANPEPQVAPAAGAAGASAETASGNEAAADEAAADEAAADEAAADEAAADEAAAGQAAAGEASANVAAAGEAVAGEAAGETSVGAEGATARSERRRSTGTARVEPSSPSTTTTMMTTESAMAAATDASMASMAAPSATAETAAAPEPSRMDSMEDLLDRALGGMAAAPAEAPAAMAAAVDPASLPDTPDRAAVSRALGGLMPRIRQCAGDQVGLATARIRVANDGSVSTVTIAGSPFGGTPQGTCMEGVVKTARFPRFRQSQFDVTYPFAIRAAN